MDIKDTMMSNTAVWKQDWNKAFNRDHSIKEERHIEDLIQQNVNVKHFSGLIIYIINVSSLTKKHSNVYCHKFITVK